MKDLTHYFMDVEKSFGETKIHPNGVNNGSTSASTDDVISKKRGRVKIRISQKDNEERICHIIETKHDLVDKTPSPFTPFVKEKNKGCVSGETPKRSDSPIVLSDSSMSPTIYSPPKRRNNEKYDQVVEVKMEESDNIKRTEGSNAFKVLMTRSKPVQYLPEKCLSPEKEANEMRKVQEVKAKMKQNKEKLIELADKKGYTKRKLIEAEESERIEKRLDKRAMLFKRFKKDEESPVNHNQKSSRGLHNYFSTMTPEEREKEKHMALSTVTVKVDVHNSDRMKEKANVIVKSKHMNKTAKSQTRNVLAAIDDIQVLRSESPSPPLIVNVSSIDSNQSKSLKKRKWSLRINLSEGDDSSKDEIKASEEQITPKLSSRGRKRKNEKVRTSSEKNEPKSLKEKKIITIANTPKAIDESVEMIEIVSLSKNIEKLPRYDSEPITSLNKRSETPEIIYTSSQPLPDTAVVEGKVQKLAPLFLKRPKPTPEIMAARKLFLYSKSPEDPGQKLKKNMVTTGPTFLPFPSLSHIRQITPDENNVTVSINSEKILSKSPCTYRPTFNVSDFKLLNHSDISSVTENSRKSKNSSKPNIDDVLNEIETRCPDIREMWQVIRSVYISQSTKETPKRRGRKKKSADKNSNSSEEGKSHDDAVWTQKYRPLNVKQIVGNEDAAAKLKSWLEAWRTPVRDGYSSSEEFYSSDNSFQCGLETNQVAVLLGPHGTGKTASVYAIAEELGYTVLELNASSKRPGKKILKDFEEATRSHRIKKSDMQSQALVKNEKIPQNSLILIEDVDLVFDEDEGFVSATCQLATNTKRPIVMTCRSSCAHMSRLTPQQMKIHYHEAYGDRVRALLELITLVEGGIRLPPICLDKLLTTGDLRKALLQLQYLISSGTAQTLEVHSNFGKMLWQDVKTNIYKPAIKYQKKMEKKKEKAKESRITNGRSKDDILDRFADDLDTISIVSNFVNIDDRLLNEFQVKLEPSLSLIENEDLYWRCEDEKIEISEWLRDKVMERYKDNVKEDKPSSNQILLIQKELNFGVNLALSQITPNNLDNYSVRTDYLPTARTICRAEHRRITSNSKRGNRFFHYLQSLRLPSASTKSNILTAACKILWDNEQCENI